MRGRKFTKKEETLFYINLGVIVIGLMFSLWASGDNWMIYTANASVRHSLGYGLAVAGIFGMFIVLLDAQYCHGWSTFYIVVQIIICISLTFSSIGTGVGSGALSVLKGGEWTPESKEALRNATDTARQFFDRNPDTQILVSVIEEAFGCCGLYEKTDSLGISCPYSNKEVCEKTNETLLSALLTIAISVLKSLAIGMFICALIEIGVLVFAIIARKSYKEQGSLELPIQTEPALQQQIPTGQFYYAQPVVGKNAEPTAVPMVNL